MPTSPKSFNQIMQDMMGGMLAKTSIEDLKTGSVIEAFFDSETKMRGEIKRVNLIRFLTKLDPRFRKHISPWAEVELAQRYFSKL